MSGYMRPKNRDRWQLQVYTGQIKDGKREKVVKTVIGSTKRLDSKGKPIPPKYVKDELTELLSSVHKGTYTPLGQLTVEEHLRNWIEGYIKSKCSPRTLDTITSIAEHHIIPVLGKIQLKNLQPSMIQRYYSKAMEQLSARSVHTHHRYLKQSLKWGVRQGYIGKNPCELVDAPTFKPKTMRTLTPSELEILLEVTEDNQFYPVIYTAVSTGLRQAELLGLRFRDINLDMAAISVSQVLYKRRGECVFKEPKTSHSRRRVGMTPKLALYLREYVAEQESLYLHSGQMLNLNRPVFAHIDGSPLDPSTLTHNFQRLVKKAKLDNMRFHDLRHTFASLMFLCGVSPKVVSEALGHSSVAFTMDVYSHIIKGMQEDAMALLNEVLPSGKNTSFQKINAQLTPKADKMTIHN